MYIRNAHGEYSMPNINLENCYCCVKGCFQIATDRAHVRKCKYNGEFISRDVYVVPMCTTHNRSKSDEVFEVKDDTNFVRITD